MRRLGLIDSLFLLFDHAKQPMHVMGVCVFDYPDDANDDFVKHLYHQSLQADLPVSPFNQIRHRQIFWQTIAQFDLQAHCHYHKLTLGDNKDLQRVISDLHQIHLNHKQPLWALHLIDNIQQNGKRQFAICLKIHHALADGVAAVRLFQSSLSDDSTQRSMPFAPWVTRPKRPKSSLPQKSNNTLLASSASVLRALVQDYQDAKQQNARFVSSLAAAKSPLNQRIDHTRQISLCTLQKSRLVKVANALSVSTNEVALAICGQAIHRYLQEQFGEQTKQPLIAFAPISLRRDDSQRGNQLSFLPANLGLPNDTPIARIRQVHQSLDYGKQRYTKMDFAEVVAHTALHYGWAGINLATGLYPNKQAFHLVISNVPAADKPLYFNGAKLRGMYPASVLFDGQAMNISFCNHQDQLDFGIVACPSVLPNTHRLVDLLAQALNDCEHALSATHLND